MESSLKRAAGFEIRTLPIDRLVPAPYNPRTTLKPTDRAYRKLEASLREFGLVEPLVWNERTGHVVGGHARLAIMRAMGATEVPVSVVQLDDAHEKALNVVLNNQEAQGRFDSTKLADLLIELEELPQLAQTGFDISVIPTLRLSPINNPLTSVPESAEVTVTLQMDKEKYRILEPHLNELIGTFDVKAHVTGGHA